MDAPRPPLSPMAELWISLARLSISLHEIQSSLGFWDAARRDAEDWLRAYA